MTRQLERGMPFRYLRDPLFLASTGLFVLNVTVLKKAFPGSQFFNSYLTDLLCLPVWIPFMVWGMRGLKWRDDSPPRLLEIFAAWAFWSVMFEGVMPRVNFVERFAPGDIGDVVAYGLGGVLAFLAWQAWYSTRRTLKLKA